MWKVGDKMKAIIKKIGKVLNPIIITERERDKEDLKRIYNSMKGNLTKQDKWELAQMIFDDTML